MRRQDAQYTLRADFHLPFDVGKDGAGHLNSDAVGLSMYNQDCVVLKCETRKVTLQWVFDGAIFDDAICDARTRPRRCAVAVHNKKWHRR